jgi:hypothetical protein
MPPQSNVISTTSPSSCPTSLSASDPPLLGPASARTAAAISGKAIRTCSCISRLISISLRSIPRVKPDKGATRASRSRRPGCGPPTRWRQTGQVVAPRSHCYSKCQRVKVLLMQVGLYLQTAFMQPMRTVGQFHDPIVLLILRACFVRIGDLEKLLFTHVVQTDRAALITFGIPPLLEHGSWQQLYDVVGCVSGSYFPNSCRQRQEALVRRVKVLITL